MQVKVKPKKCKNCGQTYTPKFKTTEPCPNYDCRVALLPKVMDKVKSENKKAAARELKALKVKVTDWRKKLQLKLQEIARLIDYGQPCLAKGTTTGQLQGGHINSRGGHSNIALNLHNIHRQSAQSNHWQSDDRLMHEGVKREYGIEYYNELQSLLGFQMPKYTADDWMKMYRTACSISNELKKNLKVNDTAARIDLRTRFNKMIGIYTQ